MNAALGSSAQIALTPASRVSANAAIVECAFRFGVQDASPASKRATMSQPANSTKLTASVLAPKSAVKIANIKTEPTTIPLALVSGGYFVRSRS